MSNIFIILLNTYLLISIPVYWTTQRWSVLQSSYFTFGILGLFIISEFCLDRLRNFKNIWAGFFALISLASIFLHNYYISDFTRKFSSFSLMSEGFIYVLCGLLFLKIIYEYGSNRLRDYPILWLMLLIWIAKEVLDKSFTSISAIIILFLFYLFRKKKYTIVYFISLPIILGIYKFLPQLVDSFQSRIWTNIVLVKDILSNPLGRGFDNSLNGNMIYCNMYNDWGLTILNRVFGIGSVLGLVYPHNDYLNIARDLGVPALMCVILGIMEFFKNIKGELLAYLCLAILLMAMFNTTWYMVDNAIRFIPLFSLLAIRKEGL